MTNKIHPIIQSLAISKDTKAYFNKLEFYEIIEDPIVLSNNFNDIDEAMANCWRFGVDLKFCTGEEIKIFYQAVIDSRKKYLIENISNQKMIFYTWYDAQSGNLHFSLIPLNWTKLPPGKELPFECIINKFEYMDEVIEEFINDPYKGNISWDELTSVDSIDKQEDEYEQNTHVVNVWSTIL